MESSLIARACFDLFIIFLTSVEGIETLKRAYIHTERQRVQTGGMPKQVGKKPRTSEKKKLTQVRTINRHLPVM